MSAPKHAARTPGPWRVSGDGKIIGQQSGCSSPIIAEMPVWWHDKQPGEHVSQDIQAANARLIAAAPDLLAACQAVVAHDGDRIDQDAWFKLRAWSRAAVALATGGAQ